MAEIRFDAVLNDQMSEPLAAIATALAGISDVVGTVAKDFTGAFESMTQKAVTFADTAPLVTDSVAGMAEMVATFTDTSASNFIQAMKAMNDATTSFFSATDSDVSALETEATTVSDLATVFGNLASQKDLAAISEEDLKNATDGSQAALLSEATAADTTAAALTNEADAGAADQPNRESGYGAVMGAVALLGMAGAAVKVGESLLQSGIQSQAALTMVTSLADQNAAHVGIYEQGLQKIAIATGTSLTDLAGGLYDITSVGFQAGDALGILDQAAKAAAVGGTNLHDVTNGLTSIMIAFGMDASQAAGALNTLVIGVRDGKAHFADFSRAIGLVGDTAKNAGFSFNQSAAALAAMSAVYPTVRQAGQNLRSLMQDLGMKMDTVAKDAHKMGLSFNEQTFASKDLYGRLMYLKDITHGNQAEMTKLLGGVQGLNAYFAITASGGERYAQALKDMSTQTGTLDQAFNNFKQSMQAHINVVNASLSVLSANFALLAQPVVLATLTAIADTFAWLADMFQQHARIMTAVLIVLAGLIAGTLVGAIVALIEAMWKWIAMALDAATPFIIIGVAIGIFVAWLVAAYQHSQPFRDAIQQLGTALRQMWAALQPLIASIGALIGQALQPLITVLFGSASGVGKNHDALTKIKSPIDLITVAIQGLTGLVQRFTSWLNSLHQTVTVMTGPTTILGHAMHGVHTAIGGLAGQLDAMNGGLNKTSQSFSGLKTFVLGLLGPLGVLLTTVLSGGGAFAAISGHVTALKGGFGGFIDALHAGREGIVAIVNGIRSNFIPVLDVLARFIKNPRLLLLEWGKVLDAHILPLFDAFSANIMRVRLAIQGFMTSGFSETLGQIVIKAVQLVVSFGEFTSVAIAFTGVAMLIAGAVAGTVMQFMHWYNTSSQFRNMLAGFGKDLQSIWTLLQAQLNPVFKQLSETWKTQILPLGAQLMELWKSIQPALMLVGAIVIGILVIAFGILVSVIKAVISALGPFLTGLIQVVGGIIRAVTGFVQIIVTIVGGIATLLYDLIFNQKAFVGDAQKLWNNLKNGIINIVAGLWQVVEGLWNGIVVTVVTLVVSFVGNIISWFQHLFETLVGHSIVTDLVNRILELFTFIFVTIPNLAFRFVIGLIERFQLLFDMGVALFLRLSVEVPMVFTQMVTNLLAAALRLETTIIVYVNAMIMRAIAFFIKLRIEAPIIINEMIAAALAIFMALRDRATQFVSDLVTNAVNTLHNLISLLPQPVQTAVNNIFGILSGTLGRATSWGQNFMQNLIGGIGNMMGSLRNTVSNVVNAIAGPLAHASPAKEGPLAQDDKWMPNMMAMMEDGIVRNTPRLQTAAQGAALAIKNGITSQSGALAAPVAAGGAVSGLVAGGGATGVSGQPLAVTLNLNGGLGAGLQLLNPSDRQTFVRQIAVELGNQMNLQGRVSNGYSGL